MFMLLVVAVLALAGCKSPVPQNTFKGTLGGKPFEISTKKQTKAEGIHLSYSDGSNVFKLDIDKIEGSNDPQVISKSYAGRVAEINAMRDLVGTAVEGAVKGGAKGMKGGM